MTINDKKYRVPIEMDKEYAKQMVIKGWEENCPYRAKLTDGTDEDLRKTLEFIDKNW